MRGRTNLPQDVVSNVEGGVSIPGIDLNLKFKPTAIAISDDLIKVIYAGGYFVAISNKNDIAFSRNGKAWEVTKIDCHEIKDVIYADNEYIIVGSTRAINSDFTQGFIGKSEDLVDWTIKNDVPIYENSNVDRFCGIAWDGNTFVIGAEGETKGTSGEKIYALKSNDLISFEHISLTSGLFVGVKSVLYQNARFLISLFTNSSQTMKNIYCSADGTNYNSVLERDLMNIFYTDGYFLGCKYNRTDNYTYNHTLCKSINGLNWTKATTGNMSYVAKIEQYNNCLFINGTYIFCGTSKGFYLEDLEKIVDIKQEDLFSITSAADLYSCISDSNTIVVVGSGGVIITADIKVEDKELTIIPSLANQERAVRLSDNLRMVKVPAVSKTIDANIRPENIKEGISILGITGTYNQPIIN